MTEEEIIELAIEHTIHGLKFDEDGLIRFAKLVAEHERERIFKQSPCEGAVQVSAWEFNMLSHQKDDLVGKPIAWAQWPKDDKSR
jgi:hypothetical protein